MRSAGCIVIFTIFIERPKKSTLIPTKCITLINNERADINIERADGRSDDADDRSHDAVINNDGADINIEPALGRSLDTDGRSDGALVNMRETMASLFIKVCQVKV
ncbi:hypothetical protein JCM15579A_01130 [Marinifilum fragile]